MLRGSGKTLLVVSLGWARFSQSGGLPRLEIGIGFRHAHDCARPETRDPKPDPEHPRRLAATTRPLGIGIGIGIGSRRAQDFAKPDPETRDSIPSIPDIGLHFRLA